MGRCFRAHKLFSSRRGSQTDVLQMLVFLLGYWAGKRAGTAGLQKAALASVLQGLDGRLHGAR